MYARISKDSIKISPHLLEVIDSNTRVSRQAILRYLNNRKALGDTIWEGVFSIGIGVLAKISKEPRIHFHEIPIPRTNGDPADRLTNIISAIVKNQKVLIRFSGGLDSTSILTTCASVTETKNILALTWFSKFDGASADLTNSTKIAKALNIEHHLIEIDEESLFQITATQNLPGYPTPALAFSKFLETLNNYSIRHFNGITPVILDGHGGDHIFLEYIDPFMLRSCVGKGFFRKLKEYCQLNATEFLKTTSKIIKGRDPENLNILHKRYRTGSWPRYFMTSPGSMRKNIIREALDEIGAPKTHQESKLFYPLLHPLMIGCALSYNLTELFNSTNSRIPLRNSLSKKFGAELFNQACKGAVTGSFQKSLAIQRKHLTNLVTNGYCASNNLIDIEAFKETYETSARGINGINYELMKIIMLELLISHTHRRISRRHENEIIHT
ncbi:asparagine synthase-related protein [Metapseudomonas resinovorans]|uniref:asparagine synthase-related protein n=1 Tax=Metapseudomonas resinovorans TaxID=53412 RepID=UPI00098503F4